ncbi:hypothetical protein C0992_000010 [Termitomyces sp. T32_za158]|nr:hypothetical protein C0992_000010 [Termitomyces sp. T32_za158]
MNYSPREFEPVGEMLTAKTITPTVGAGGGRLGLDDREVSGTKWKRPTNTTNGISAKKRRNYDGGTFDSRRGEVRHSPAVTMYTHTDDGIYTSESRRNPSWSSTSGSSRPHHEIHVGNIESPAPMLAPDPRHPPPSRVQVITWTNELKAIDYLISQGKTDERDEEKLHRTMVEKGYFEQENVVGSDDDE